MEISVTNPAETAAAMPPPSQPNGVVADVSVPSASAPMTEDKILVSGSCLLVLSLFNIHYLSSFIVNA